VEHTRRTLSVVAAAGMLMLAACNGDPEATPPPTTSSPPPPTPSASTPSTPPKPTPPAIPPAATNGLTVTSAEAFARFYLTVVDYAEGSGDSALLRRYADRECIVCDALAKTYEQTYSNGGAVTGDFHTRNVHVSAARLVGADTATVAISGSEGSSKWRKSRQANVVSFPPHRVSWDLTLAAANGHWAMFAMVRK